MGVRGSTGDPVCELRDCTGRHGHELPSDPWLPLARGPSCMVHRSVHRTPSLDRTFFALSDPTRREILGRLAEAPATLSELAAPFGLTINGVKKHVGILEDVDLVLTSKVGRVRECRLGPAGLDAAARWIDDYRRAWKQRLDRFGDYVEQRR